MKQREKSVWQVFTRVEQKLLRDWINRVKRECLQLRAANTI